ncbi:hypothetical protein [Paenibacillus paeoniae]|uniref:hypothetical protein n=1 Tax=Paenibacillus paeoniae TaxID=2292705 RepID=UPI00140404CF|nr:hypothetical protein [Paenibacillus paeoniae]
MDGWRGALDGDRLVAKSDDKLTVIDLATNKQLASISVEYEAGFDISGNYVVWSDLRNEQTSIGELGSYDEANADIFLYNLSTGEERQLTTDSSAQIQPRIWENYMVWMDNSSDTVKEYPTHWQIVLYNIETGEQKTITSGDGGHTDPDIDAGNVVWEDGRHVTKRGLRGGGNLPENNTDIYLYRIETGETIPIAIESYKEGLPRVSGNLITWEAFNGSYKGNAFVYDTVTEKTLQVTNLAVDQRTPVIHGKFVAWMDERNGSSTHDVGPGPHDSDIYLADLEKGTEVRISGEGPQILPLISDRWIVYGKSTDAGAVLTAVRHR